MKLLLDMNLSPRWVTWFRDLGWQAEHWSAVGPANATDSAVMTFAASNGFILVTHDLDFSAILAVTHGRKPSVVQVRGENVSPELVGHQIVTALRNLEAELVAGALVNHWPSSDASPDLTLAARRIGAQAPSN